MHLGAFNRIIGGIVKINGLFGLWYSLWGYTYSFFVFGRGGPYPRLPNNLGFF